MPARSLSHLVSIESETIFLLFINFISRFLSEPLANSVRTLSLTLKISQHLIPYLPSHQQKSPRQQMSLWLVNLLTYLPIHPSYSLGLSTNLLPFDLSVDKHQPGIPCLSTGGRCLQNGQAVWECRVVWHRFCWGQEQFMAEYPFSCSCHQCWRSTCLSRAVSKVSRYSCSSHWEIFVAFLS